MTIQHIYDAVMAYDEEEIPKLVQAEHKRSQIQSYGADKRLARSKGSMSAIVEKAD